MRRNEKIIADFSASLLELLESGIPLDTSLEVIHSQDGASSGVRKLSGKSSENFPKATLSQPRLPCLLYMRTKNI